jgi:hypothetical protein
LTVAQIAQATGWALPNGARPTQTASSAGDVCNWEDPAIAAIVQVQLHRGAGAARFDERQRTAAAQAGRPAETIHVAGATKAFEVGSEGLLGMVVGGRDYVQVNVIGPTARPDAHRRLAELVAKALQ